MRGSLVLLRAAVVAALALMLGALAHVSVDGLLPSRPALVFLYLLCLAAAVPLLTRPASRLRVLAVLAGGQTLIHVGLTLTAGHRGDPVAAPPVDVPALSDQSRKGSLVDQYEALQARIAASATGGTPGAAADAGPLAHLWDHLAEQSPWMLLLHTVAVLAVGLWLAAGESALWSLLVLSGTGVFVIMRSVLAGAAALGVCVPPGPLSVPARRRRRVAVPTPHLLRRVVAYRGPPVLLAS